LVSDFKRTSDWVANTGQGVRAEHSEETWQQLVASMNKYYYILEPILGDRPSTRPAFTSDDNFELEDIAEDMSVNSINDDDEITDTDVTNVFDESFDASTTNVTEKSIQNNKEPSSGSTTTSSIPGKRPATFASDAVKEKKRKSRGNVKQSGNRSQNTIIVGGPDNLDGYLQRKMEFLNVQVRNEEARIDVEKGRYQLEMETHKIQEKALIAKANVEVAESNLRMMQLRKDAKQINPDITKEELDECFPLCNSSQYSKYL
jgi:hypothetical protein